HIGPMTRTVRDNALMLQLIAGHDPGDPGSADEPVPDYGALLGQDVRGLRIGVIRHFYTRDVAGDPEQVEAIDATVELLAEAGAEIREITLPALQDFSACGQIILAAEAYAVHEQWLKERPEDYGARARERLLAGATLRAVDYLQAVRWRLQLRDRVAAAFADIDLAITASSMDPACRIDDDEALAANYWRQARMPFNVTGQPGLVIPASFSKSGLPVIPLAKRCSTASRNSMRTRPVGRSAILRSFQTEGVQECLKPARAAAIAAESGSALGSIWTCCRSAIVPSARRRASSTFPSSRRISNCCAARTR